MITELANASNGLARALLELMAPTLPGAHIGTHDFRYLLSSQQLSVTTKKCRAL